MSFFLTIDQREMADSAALESSFPFPLFSSTEQGSIFGEVTALSALLVELLPAHHSFHLICWFITVANFQGAFRSSLSSY